PNQTHPHRLSRWWRQWRRGEGGDDGDVVMWVMMVATRWQGDEDGGRSFQVVAVVRVGVREALAVAVEM
nr:hypothetical protein [Tanacetum cinerariifolium]